ncbi:ABC transporter substrate-binding protein [Paenibacillus eucommiae]|uniref:Multiple sugar transport system substrate-binding protein n=1 Tax=Paenibacillus eucommiae TaxID=1355755 RepID=A0ABS4IPC5_9BACL|nr:extracellular solute-binding protein [Paenibacillus eucommiae]MBP1989368.1 multiple sugar transport system substrate-binding protein [Paenibacillus eucommiae]
MRKMGLFLIISLLVCLIASCNSSTDSGKPNQSNRGEVEKSNSGTRETLPPEATGDQSEHVTNSPSQGKKTIVFSTFYESDFLKEAKKKYEAKHPNFEIQLIHAHANGEDANWEANHEKFVKTTNTQMLTGKGPDLLEMDQLPIGQYVNKKVLANMSEMMDNDPSFQREQYFTNILDNVKLNGGVYGMPVRFYLYGIIGDEEAINKTGVTFDDKNWTWSQFIETVKELKQKGDREYAFMGRPEYMLSQMVKGDYAAYVDQIKRKGNFDSGEFASLMKQIKTMFDEKVISGAYDFPDTYFIEDMFSSIRNFILSGTTQNVNTFKQRKLYNKPIAEGQKPGGFFRTETTIGINANSSVKKEAWDFVKFLISDEVNPGGFPLNKNVYQKLAQQILQEGSVKADEEGQAHGQIFKVREEDILRLNSYISDAIHPVEFKPSKVEDIILEESKAFFNGQKSAEAVAKLVQNRVTTVLNE